MPLKSVNQCLTAAILVSTTRVCAVCWWLQVDQNPYVLFQLRGMDLLAELGVDTATSAAVQVCAALL
jgi:hypothetical protein